MKACRLQLYAAAKNKEENPVLILFKHLGKYTPIPTNTNKTTASGKCITAAFSVSVVR